MLNRREKKAFEMMSEALYHEVGQKIMLESKKNAEKVAKRIDEKIEKFEEKLNELVKSTVKEELTIKKNECCTKNNDNKIGDSSINHDNSD